MCVLAAMAENQADSAKIYFKIGHRQFYPELGDNRASMDRFVRSVRQARDADDIDHILVRAYASPDGQKEANERLTGYRCDEIARYITDATGISPDLIQSVPEGIAWDELRRLVAANAEVPSRDKVLDILDNTPVWVFDATGRVVDSRKRQLMQLDGGTPYRWMFANLFPDLRNAVAVSLYLKSAILAAKASEAETARISALTSQSVDTTPTEPAEPNDTVAQPAPIVPVIETEETIITEDVEETPAGDPLHRFALKTNMLYYIALMPNLELEWRINHRWSLLVEGNVAWWHRDAKHKYYEVAMISPEARYWLPRGTVWHGMYVGAFGGYTWYDLENGNKGYRGEGGLAGLSFGYMWPVTRCLSLEAGLGAGYMYTRYKEYIPFDGHYLYQRTKNMNYFGPLKLKFSLVWRFNDINKSKKVRKAL